VVTLDLLNGYRVIDLTNERGLLAGRMLADLGADVIQIEPPQGSSARRVTPLSSDPVESPSLYWEAYASNKRSVVLDLDSRSGQSSLLDLIASADFLFESSDPGWAEARGLDFASIARINPWCVYVSITPFGHGGPKSNWNDSELICWAAGGALFFNRDEDRPPVRISVPQAYFHASADAASAALIAHRARVRDGIGQRVDISVQVSAAQATLSAVLSAAVGDHSTYPVEGTEQVTSSRRRLDLSGSGSASRRTKWPVLDGYVEMHLSLGPAAGRFTNNLFKWLGEMGVVDRKFVDLDWVAAPDLYKSGGLTFDELELARAQVAAYFATRTKAELLDAAIARKMLLAPIYTVEDLLISPQFIDRRFFVTLEDPHGDNLTLPGPLVWIDGEPTGRRSKAPRLGEHQATWASDVASRPHGAGVGTNDDGPVVPALEGLKVADLSWVVAGPMIGRVLADYGATVVRVESSWRVETNRLVGPFRDGVQHAENSASYGNCNAGKLGVTLDLSLQEGRDVVLDLIKWADVVIESFSPGVMEKWGLAFADIQKVNPSVIMVSTSLLGQTGRMANFAGYGNIGAAISGYQNIVGWPDRPPLGPFGPYSDYVGPRFSLVALMAALDRRDRDGVGAHLDIAQAEAAIHFLAPEVAQFVQQGVVASRRGNRDLQMAPHGVYKCASGEIGRSRWIAIAIRSDEEWRTFADVIGQPEVADDPDFATAEARLTRADELDERVAAWVLSRSAPDVESLLQGAGLAAHVASSSLDLLDDPQLVQRRHFVVLEHPLHGTTTVENSRFVMSRTPAVVRRAAPTLGQHNEHVLRDILGYSRTKYQRLMDANVLR